MKHKLLSLGWIKYGIVFVLGVVVTYVIATGLEIQTNINNAVQTIQRVFVTSDGKAPTSVNTVVELNPELGKPIRVPSFSGENTGFVVGIANDGTFIRVPDGGGDDILFSGDRPITRDAQTIFNTQCFPSGQTGTVKDFLECVFFPDLGPIVSITVDGSANQTLAKTNASNFQVTIAWSVTKRTNNIASIQIIHNSAVQTSAPVITVGGGNQNSSYIATITANSTFPQATFTIIAKDTAGKSASAIARVNRSNYVYWGKNPLIDLTSNATIIALNKQLSNSWNVGIKNFPGNGYIYLFAPATYGTRESFTINGLTNNNFESTTLPITNHNNYLETYRRYRLRDFSVDDLNVDIK